MVNIYLVGAASVSFDLSDTSRIRIAKNAQGKVTCITLILTPEEAAQINQDLADGYKAEEKIKELDPVADADKIFALRHPFTKQNYNVYWNVEVYYPLRINGGFPTETSVNAAADKDSQIDRSFALAQR